MSAEIEAAVLDGHRDFFRRKPRHTAPVGSPCANCETPLLGPWCHACGQSSEHLHRSVLHLVAEAVEGFTHFDGRFWRTIPGLVLRPGKLTYDYIHGHRAGQIPPLRLFLVVLLLIFFAGSIGSARPGEKPLMINPGTPAQRAAAEKDLSKVQIELGAVRLNGGGMRSTWLKTRALRALQDPEAFTRAVEQWAHRFAVLMLPISALILTILFAFQRRFYVFDHMIFSMHSLSFQGLLLTPLFLFGEGAAGWLLLLSPVHLFLHMRGAYETSIAGTLTRMALLLVASAIGFSLLLLGLLWIGLEAMKG